jgi:hypothetical protein
MQAAIAFTLATPDFPDMLPVANRIASQREQQDKKAIVVRTLSPRANRSHSPMPASTTGQRRSLDLCPGGNNNNEQSMTTHAPKSDVLQEAFNRILKIDVSAPSSATSSNGDGPRDPWQALTLSSWIGTAHPGSYRPVGSIETSGAQPPSDHPLAAGGMPRTSSAQERAPAVSGMPCGADLENGKLGSVMGRGAPVCGELQPSRGKPASFDSSVSWGSSQQLISAQASVAEGILGSKYVNQWRRNMGTPPDQSPHSLPSIGRTASPSPELLASPSGDATSSFGRSVSADGRPPCGNLSSPTKVDLPLSPFSFSPPASTAACESAGLWPSPARLSFGTYQEGSGTESNIEGIRSMSLNNWLPNGVRSNQPIGVVDPAMPRSSTLRPIGCTTELDAPSLRSLLGGTAAAQRPTGVGDPSSFRQNLLGGWHPSGVSAASQVGSPSHPAGLRSARAKTLHAPHSMPTGVVQVGVKDRADASPVGQLPVKHKSFDLRSSRDGID